VVLIVSFIFAPLFAHLIPTNISSIILCKDEEPTDPTKANRPTPTTNTKKKKKMWKNLLSLPFELLLLEAIDGSVIWAIGFMLESFWSKRKKLIRINI
jgi:hypothetical protein